MNGRYTNFRVLMTSAEEAVATPFPTVHHAVMYMHENLPQVDYRVMDSNGKECFKKEGNHGVYYPL